MWEALHEEVEAEFAQVHPLVHHYDAVPFWLKHGLNIITPLRPLKPRVPKVAPPPRVFKGRYRGTKSTPSVRETRERRKAAGLCIECEVARDPESSNYCPTHREQDRLRAAEKRERRRGMREKLLDDREGVAHHFVLIVRNEEGDGTHEVDGYIHTGVYPDGRVGEIFIKVGKPGDLYAALDQWAIAFSIALQYGAPLETLCRKFINTKFAPSGATRNKDIARCTSLTDYVCRFLLKKYCKTEEPIDEVPGPLNGETLQVGTAEVRS